MLSWFLKKERKRSLDSAVVSQENGGAEMQRTKTEAWAEPSLSRSQGGLNQSNETSVSSAEPQRGRGHGSGHLRSTPLPQIYCVRRLFVCTQITIFILLLLGCLHLTNESVIEKKGMRRERDQRKRKKRTIWGKSKRERQGGRRTGRWGRGRRKEKELRSRSRSKVLSSLGGGGVVIGGDVGLGWSSVVVLAQLGP